MVKRTSQVPVEHSPELTHLPSLQEYVDTAVKKIINDWEKNHESADPEAAAAQTRALARGDALVEHEVRMTGNYLSLFRQGNPDFYK